MAFLVSPGVQVKETDLTNVIPATSSSIGAIAGPFQWGPVDEVITVGSEQQLVETFGQPTQGTFESFYGAAQFLSFGNTLRVVRVVDEGDVDIAATCSVGGDIGTAAVADACSVGVEGTDWTSGDAASCTIQFEADGVTRATYTAAIAATGNWNDQASCEALFEVDGTTPGVFTAASILAGSAKNASADGGKLIKNDDHFDTLGFGAADWVAARFPGSVGNSLGVTFATQDMWNDVASTGAWIIEAFNPDGTRDTSNDVDLTSLFTDAPGTSSQAVTAGRSKDEIHVVVYDAEGRITGDKNSILEVYSFLSLATNAMSTDGTSNYFKEHINRNSRWIRVGTAAVDLGNGSMNSGTGAFTAPADNFVTELTGGTSGNVIISLGDLIRGYDKFTDTETIEVSLIIQSMHSVGGIGELSANLVALADARKDCVAFVSPMLADTVGNQSPVAAIKTWRTAAGQSSYAFADSGALYIYDKYVDLYRWVPASGAMAGLAANADNVADPWWSPAGFSRGAVRNVARLAFNPNQADRDDLYKIGVNPIVSFPGMGTVLYGDKTLQSKPSAFDRINVRRLFITLEKAISTASKFQLFEFNDEFTRAQFRNMVEPFLRDIKGRRGITDFRVVCDESNNTGDIIDTNRFVADIYIKPARSINFITLNFIATRTGVEFSEIAGGN